MIPPPVLFSEVVNGGSFQEWFDNVVGTVRDIASNFPAPLAVLIGVILIVIVVRMVVNLL